jgi:hypothetical protein
MKQSRSWEARNCSTAGNSPSFGEPEDTFPCSQQKAVVSILWKTRQTPSPCFVDVHFNIIFLRYLGFPTVLLASVSERNSLQIPHFSDSYYMLRLTYIPILDHRNSVSLNERIMKILMHFVKPTAIFSLIILKFFPTRNS